MILYKDIIKEEDNRLREKSQDVELPLKEEDIQLLNDLNEYIVNGYDDKLVEEYQLRPGVGLSAVQIGVLKKIFVIMAYDEEGVLHHYGIINPKITSHSEEKVYLSFGEGCLSVDRETEGLVHRHKRITTQTYLYNFEDKSLNYVKIKFKDYMSIIFQHEFDHLNGILFVDRFDKNNPFFVPENSKPIIFETEEENVEENDKEKEVKK